MVWGNFMRTPNVFLLISQDLVVLLSRIGTFPGVQLPAGGLLSFQNETEPSPP